ncbi:Enoyl-CoA hydratase [Parasphingorhabdus marina DSM 22363]|uniref:Enoyl-CoA hydratase n=1 Tax=Parasphingorhabdus marina DSM 22363 TaxID=1123272 RepID=A0A1N6DC81_9SPHN|nr:enoyl-CoA hydratase [Parasphingorhabdus marina]SIN68428.1 Enoyl-CoA hydratase [Parasphingorhabdus marina DSM 22363]
MSNNIDLSTADRVTTLTIARADKKNAITQDMYAAMAEAITDYGQDMDVRALVITGAGDMFTAGNDLQDFSTGGADQDEIPPVSRFLHALRDCPKPVVAAVNGPAIGVGLTMLLHCDLVYAGQSATFNAPFVKLGLVPEAASSLLLPAAVGMAVANDILLAGRTLNAEEALRFGLIARIFPDGELQEAARQIALHIASSAPNALRQSKSLIRNQRDQIADQMQAEGRLFVDQLQSPDFRESVAAMMEKRAPNYG